MMHSIKYASMPRPRIPPIIQKTPAGSIFHIIVIAFFYVSLCITVCHHEVLLEVVERL
jgi:hypothetical protein